jgi:hypothetical protein
MATLTTFDDGSDNEDLEIKERMRDLICCEDSANNKHDQAFHFQDEIFHLACVTD